MVKRLGTSAGDIEQAAQALRGGRLVAFPTETVYGLGAVATNDRAVAAIFAAKERPRFNPLIVHVTDARAPCAALERYRGTAGRALLARRAQPGPAAGEGCPLSLLVSAGGDTVALRAPAHPAAQALLAATVLPVAAPSANPAGQVSPTTAEHVAAGLGDRIDLIVDGGPCPIGVESTVLDVTCTPPRLLRPGASPARRSRPRSALWPALHRGAMDQRRSPGQLHSHYAPTRPLRLDAETVDADEALLAFGPPAPGRGADAEPEPARRSRGGRRESVRHAARAGSPRVPGDRRHAGAGDGLGEAIGDRLRRAAAPRPKTRTMRTNGASRSLFPRNHES